MLWKVWPLQLASPKTPAYTWPDGNLCRLRRTGPLEPALCRTVTSLTFPAECKQITSELPYTVQSRNIHFVPALSQHAKSDTSCTVWNTTRPWALVENPQQSRASYCLKDVTWTQQWRPQPPTVTLTWHESEHKGHKLHPEYKLTPFICWVPVWHTMKWGCGHPHLV